MTDMKNTFKKGVIGSELVSRVVIITTLVMFVLLPFLSFLIVLSVAALYAGSGRDYNIKHLTSLVVLVLVPYVALKTSLPYLGNDKFQYIGYMDIFRNGGFWDVISIHPEIVSFGLIYLTSIFENNNLAFSVIFIGSISMFLYALSLFDKRSIPFFLLLLLSSSIFLNLFGNLIRQGLALAFCSLVFFEKRERMRYLWCILAIFSHIPSVIILACFFLGSRIKNLSVLSLIFIYLISYLISHVVPSLLESMSFASEGVIEKKAMLYSNWEDIDTSSSMNTFVLLSVVILFIEILSIKFNVFIFTNKKATLYNIIVLLGVVLLITSQLDKVFERYYLYYFIFSIFYISYALYSIRYELVKRLITTLLACLLVIGSLYRFQSSSWFYMETPIKYLSDNLITIYMNLF